MLPDRRDGRFSCSAKGYKSACRIIYTDASVNKKFANGKYKC